MKIALCFSGLPRYIEESYDNIYQNLIDNNPKHQIDVYGHFWWDDSYINQIISRGNMNRYEKNMIDVFKDKFKPKKVIYEPYKKFQIPKKLEEQKEKLKMKMIMTYDHIKLSYYNGKSMFYSIKESLNLALESEIEYDLYVRIRTDIIYESKIDWDLFNNQKLNILDGTFSGPDRLLSDILAIGNYDSMLKYSLFYDFFKKYHDTDYIHIHEYLLNVLSNDLKVNVLTFKLYSPINGNGWDFNRESSIKIAEEQFKRNLELPKYLEDVF